MESKSAQIGMNRTGAQMSPLAAPDMCDTARSIGPGSPGDAEGMQAMRGTYVAEAGNVGSVPVPGTLTGMLTTGVAKLTGNNPEVLIDKLGERLAFERTGVRLYEALIAKCRAAPAQPLSVPLERLAHFRDEEARHLELVERTIASLGADPTAQTPGADVAAMTSQGVLQVLTDPRTTVAQSLNAILTAEMSDNAGWELLIGLARQAGLDNIAAEFEPALTAEREHMQSVRRWLEEAVLQEAT